MKYPYIENVPQSQSILTQFGGYNHKLSCTEGEFYDTKNITTEHFPLLSPRENRGTVLPIANLQGLFELDGLVWIANNTLYINNTAITLKDKDNNAITISNGEKTITKMGGYIVIFPDGIWFDTTAYAKEETKYAGLIESKKEYASASTAFQMVDADGDDITLWDGSGKPSDGAYKITTKGGKKVLQTYSSTTSMWMNVATTYFKITKTGVGKAFEKKDGVKITISKVTNKTAKKNLNYTNVFVNEEDDGRRSNNFVIKDKGDDFVIVTGILGSASFSVTVGLTFERKKPDVAYVCECQNRLWTCSSDGHEISCCKQGDVTNWNSFAGVSLDSWTATVGSEGKFTGAFAYLGSPIFFKENSLLRVSVSSAGAHSYKEIECRGVQNGSAKSLVMLNELLYYKSSTNVCYYDGNFPQEIGDKLGEVRYKNAVGGSIKNRYYMSCKDTDNKSHLFVFDVNTGCWAHEDDVDIKHFARYEDDLYFYANGKLYSIYGTLPFNTESSTPGSLEGPISWSAESGWIGYETTDKKYVSRMDIRMKLDVGAYASLYMEYDSTGNWEHVWNVSGKGTKTFAIPVRPKRCDHYRYKLVGFGGAKIFGISKAYEEGSDM